MTPSRFNYLKNQIGQGVHWKELIAEVECLTKESADLRSKLESEEAEIERLKLQVSTAVDREQQYEVMASEARKQPEGTPNGMRVVRIYPDPVKRRRVIWFAIVAPIQNAEEAPGGDK